MNTTATVIATSIAVTVLLAFIGFVWSLGNWRGEVNSDRSNFKEFMSEFRDKLDDISRTVHLLLGASKTVSASESPLRLNDFGLKISEEFSAKAWAKAYAEADDVRQQVVDKSPYDVQEFCFDHVTEDILTKDELQKAKDIAYDNGTILSNVLRVLAFELRGRLLTQ